MLMWHVVTNDLDEPMPDVEVRVDLMTVPSGASVDRYRLHGIYGSITLITDAAGRWELDLPPNSDIIPNSTFWRARHYITGVFGEHVDNFFHSNTGGSIITSAVFPDADLVEAVMGINGYPTNIPDVWSNTTHYEVGQGVTYNDGSGVSTYICIRDCVNVIPDSVELPVCWRLMASHGGGGGGGAGSPQEILDALTTVDGDGSGLDADLLDGNEATAFQPALGFTPENSADKGVVDGYAPLDSGLLVPAALIGGAGATAAKYLRGDRSWADFNTAVRANRLDQMAAPTASVGFNNQRATQAADPQSSTDLATMAYVDAVAQGLKPKAPARMATTEDIVLSGIQTLDGVNGIADDSVLVKDQANKEDNGIYLMKVGAWVRRDDADADAEVLSGMFIFVSLGSTQAASGWVLTTPDPIEIGVSELTFVQFSGGGASYSDGAGLLLTGNRFDVQVDDTTTEINADRVVVKPDVFQPKGEYQPLGDYEPALGFTPEDEANKSSDSTMAPSLVEYPNKTAVANYVAGLFAELAPVLRQSGGFLPGKDPQLANINARMDEVARDTLPGGLDIFLEGDSIVSLSIDGYSAEVHMYRDLANLYNLIQERRVESGFVCAALMTAAGTGGGTTYLPTFKENGIHFTADGQARKTTGNMDGAIALIKNGTGILEFYNGDPGSGGVLLESVDTSLLANSHCNIKSYSLGTFGSKTFYVKAVAVGGVVDIVFPGFLPCYGNRIKGIRFWSGAVPGDFSQDYVDYAYKMTDLLDALALYNPATPVQMICATGFNDPTNNTTQYTALIETARAHGVQDILCVAQWWNYNSQNYLVQDDYMRAVAESHDCAFVSMGRIFGTVANNADAWETSWDGAHPFAAAAQVIGISMVMAFTGNTIGGALSMLIKMTRNPEAFASLYLNWATLAIGGTASGGAHLGPLLTTLGAKGGLVGVMEAGEMSGQYNINPSAFLANETLADYISPLGGIGGGALYLGPGGNAVTPEVLGWTRQGSLITGAQIYNPNTIVEKTTETQVVNNSGAVQDDDTLFKAVEANTKYDLEMTIFYRSATTADLKSAFSAPAGTSIIGTINGPVVTATADTGNSSCQVLDTIAGTHPNGGAGVGVTMAIHINAVVTTGANAGDLKYRWAQNTADASDTKVLIGSWMTLARRA